LQSTDPSVKELTVNGEEKTVELWFGESVSKRNQKRFRRILANTRFLAQVKRSGDWITATVKDVSHTAEELIDEITSALAGALESSRSLAKAAFATNPEFDLVVTTDGTVALKAHRSLNGSMNYINNPHSHRRRRR
jgi:hypothetical protein